MRRPVIVAFTAVAVTVTALLAGSPANAADPPEGAAYVALGDSEAAGTGNLPYLDAECMRSRKAYPELLADMYGGVDSRACAGADTADALGQALAADLGPQTRLVTITVGINNVRWQELLIVCSSAGDPAACAAAYQRAGADIATIPAGIFTLLSTVRARASNATIVVTGYSPLFGLTGRPCRVGAYQGKPVTFTFQQQVAVVDGMFDINHAIAGAVAQYAGQSGDADVTFVDVTSPFLSHRLCDFAFVGAPWISGLVSGAPVDDRSFHLNTSGQRAYANIVGAALEG